MGLAVLMFQCATCQNQIRLLLNNDEIISAEVISENNTVKFDPKIANGKIVAPCDINPNTIVGNKVPIY